VDILSAEDYAYVLVDPGVFQGIEGKEMELTEYNKELPIYLEHYTLF
jgi:hypothetical protein